MRLSLVLALLGVALTWTGYKPAGVFFLLILCGLALTAAYNQAPATVSPKAAPDRSDDDFKSHP